MFLAHNIDPAKALTSRSIVKKDHDGNFLVSAPYSRVIILLALASSGQMREIELVNQGTVGKGRVQEHLKNLKDGGLINFESVDAVDSFTSYTGTDKGKQEAKWFVYKDGQGANQRKLTSIVELAIRGLELEGKETFTTSDVIGWINKNVENPGSAKHLRSVSSVLTFFSRADVGLLERSELNKDNKSKISLTDMGQAFSDDVLKPLEAWANDPNAILAINEIRQRIKRDPNAYQDIYKQMATIYRETSPYVNSDIEAKRDVVYASISKDPGRTAPDIARKLGISYPTVKKAVNYFVASGQLQVTVGKMGRKHYSVAA